MRIAGIVVAFVFCVGLFGQSGCSTKATPDGSGSDGVKTEMGADMQAETAPTDGGNNETGPTDTGTPDTGPADDGMTDMGPMDSPADGGTADMNEPATEMANNEGSNTETAGDGGGGNSMSFFITSVGLGDGANLGGLTGADDHCKKLAEAAGVMGKTWRAYLSTSTVNAKDRIGSGPWYNAKGTMIAKDITDLHNPATNMINKDNGLDEKGNKVNGRGDTPNRHDILTGTNTDGTAATGKTCSDWTSNSTGTAVVGHHDRIGLRDDAPSKSWNSSHDSRSCSQADLQATGGDGLFYCFATQ